MFVEEKAKGEVKELDAASKLLLRAAALIEKHGLCKGTLVNHAGSYCVRGAMIVAAGETPVYIAYPDEGPSRPGLGWGNLSIDSVAVEADRRLETKIGNSAKWNNEPERTAAEVIDTLRAVAFSHR